MHKKFVLTNIMCIKKVLFVLFCFVLIFLYYEAVELLCSVIRSGLTVKLKTSEVIL